MIVLHGRSNTTLDLVPFVARITTNPNRPAVVRSDEVLVATSCREPMANGFRCLFVPFDKIDRTPQGRAYRVLDLPPELCHLEEGDVVYCNPRCGEIIVTYKRRSSSNTLLLSEECDNRCIMCCQPPKSPDNGHLTSIALQTLRLMDVSTKELGLTGGEPSLDFDRLIRVIHAARAYLPNTAAHLLSNARSFKHLDKAQKLAAIRHPQLIVGIPINSARPEVHDYIVQRRGAFDEMILGTMNLKRCGLRIEIRIVIQRINAAELVELAIFVSRNLAFADHIAFMGMEVCGYASENWDWVGVDPVDYQKELEKAVSLLAHHGLPVSIFNVPLCILSERARMFARQSISDWKVEFLPECSDCRGQALCCGVFGTSHGFKSRGIRPLPSSIQNRVVS